MGRGLFLFPNLIMNTETSIDIEALARQIAVRMDPTALLDAEDVGAMLKCTARYVREEFLKAPGFPKPLRLTGPDGRRGNPRWRRQDINAWVAAHVNGASKRGGRPRMTPDL